jgi:hypothetical protein
MLCGRSYFPPSSSRNAGVFRLLSRLPTYQPTKGLRKFVDKARNARNRIIQHHAGAHHERWPHRTKSQAAQLSAPAEAHNNLATAAAIRCAPKTGTGTGTTKTPA